MPEKNMNYKQRKARRIKISKRTKRHSSKKRAQNLGQSAIGDAILREWLEHTKTMEFRISEIKRQYIEHVALLDKVAESRKTETKKDARNSNIRLSIYFIFLVFLVCYVAKG